MYEYKANRKKLLREGIISQSEYDKRVAESN